VADNQAPFVVIDSILSEEAVLGFEYGYASNDPNTLVIWEAQFGDFANGAQVVIDQFIASGEVKWGRVNGITLMLPHGYEGQGPEHSSARLERFMQLAADTNMQVVQPTTASQIFHLLRRQMVRNLRKPLIIMTPKSLLRNKDATSPLSEFTKGGFQTVIPEHNEEVTKKADKVKRVIACSGKVYYDLAKKREEKQLDDVAILRVEQLYPFPHKALPASSRNTRTPPTSSGARMSRRTRAPGSSSSTTSTRTCSKGKSWAIPAARPRPRPPWAIRTCTRSSKRRW
jgi:2-oxoglutarate dehydrogenase E1 component